MEEALITIAVFAGIYHLIKVFTDFLLKRKLIKAGHVDKAGILNPPINKEENAYPTLKWGLVTLFGGLGLLLIAYLHQEGVDNYLSIKESYLHIGIELTAISIGFISYFLISRLNLNKK